MSATTKRLVVEGEGTTYDPVCLILEDLLGGLEKTVLNDIYDRRRWCISPWRTAEYKGIKLRDKVMDSPDARRAVFVEWGKDIDDGILYIENPERIELELKLKEYFRTLDHEVHTQDTIEFASRRFTSFIDGKQYIWRYHPPENLEMQWECIDLEGETIAYWSLKLPGEPEYYSTGCTLTICKGYEAMTLEMVTTCMVIRTIQKRYHDVVESNRLALGIVEVPQDRLLSSSNRLTSQGRYDSDDSDDSDDSSTPPTEDSPPPSSDDLHLVSSVNSLSMSFEGSPPPSGDGGEENSLCSGYYVVSSDKDRPH